MIEAMWEAIKTLAYIIVIGLVYGAVVGSIMIIGFIALMYSFWLFITWSVFVVWCLLAGAYKWGIA